ncbi:MAG: Threonylcarbamoyl-AMP synthase [Alphaproteobacteria bacterium MarineAlpha9_Bin4]|nr:threonylcarbamoyl-AMP synthase [Pelagibacterales bacterium]PPR24991.1 MAG: Threonylcarbamoyl-AMP synthase [Alphaproteobacteria bacterium MarineAlpha9_Bin4]|tara:strand:- start:85 stop:1041 length:957 start_codon:yes stop_codon:yes gene_type:complete
MVLKTKILVNSPKNIALTANLLRKNKVVGIPTETVYGLAGRADRDEVVKKIYKIKNRPLHNPLILHYKSNTEALDDIFFDDRAIELAKNFWPGALTIISKIKNNSISKIVYSNLKTLAVRVPSNRTIRALLTRLDFPLAAPSANRFGKISPTSAIDVLDELKNKIPVILDGGVSNVGIESTVIDLSTNKTKILRHGSISKKEIEKILNCKLVITNNKKFFKSPGQDLNHYQPDVPVRINAKKQKMNEGWLGFGEILDYKPPSLSLSKKRCLKEASKNLYKMLRILDKKNIKGIAVQKIPKRGIGIALNDRLYRASKKK